MMKTKTMFTIIFSFVIFIFLISSIFTVREGQRALIIKMGKIVTTSANKPKIIEPGLHFKVPFINSVMRFDIRLQTLDAQSSRILTAEQKYVLVDYYVKWRMIDIPLYYTRTGQNSLFAETLLRQKINNALRVEFSTHTINEVISTDRVNIMDVLRKKANDSAKNLGITVIDVRVKAIELPITVIPSVYASMRANREKVAAHYRFSGKSRAEAIKAQADAKVKVIVATAKTKAAKIRAEGDKKAAKIYAKAYNQNPAFYSFYRSLKAYQNTFNNKKSILVLSPKAAFFKYFNSLQ